MVVPHDDRATNQCVFTPSDALLFVGIRVREPLDLTRLAPKEPMQVWTNLVSFGRDSGMTLGTTRLLGESVRTVTRGHNLHLEKTCTLFGVTYREAL